MTKNNKTNKNYPEDVEVKEDNKSQWKRHEEYRVYSTVYEPPPFIVTAQTTGESKGTVLVVGKFYLFRRYINRI